MVESKIDKIGDLITVKQSTLPDIFLEGNINLVVDEIEKKVRTFVPDLSTLKGRKDIISLAHKIARSKTLIDSAGKRLTADWKAKAKAIDQERSKVWDRLESLQKEIRDPLTEYAVNERTRIEGHESALDQLRILNREAVNSMLIDQIEKRIPAIKDHFSSRDWEEYHDKAKEVHETTVLFLHSILSNKKLELETKKREEAENKLEQEIRKNQIRINDHMLGLRAFETFYFDSFAYSPQPLDVKINEVLNWLNSNDWEEFKDEAEGKCERAIAFLKENVTEERIKAEEKKMRDMFECADRLDKEAKEKQEEKDKKEYIPIPEVNEEVFINISGEVICRPDGQDKVEESVYVIVPLHETVHEDYIVFIGKSVYLNKEDADQDMENHKEFLRLINRDENKKFEVRQVGVVK